jgi:hypothetical protein
MAQPPRSPRPLTWGVLASPALALAACAATQPMTVSASFVDSTPHAAMAVAPPCSIDVVELVDARHAPGTLGVVAGRAVKSPDDTNAWLRSIIGGLRARGVAVDFREPASTPSDAILVRVSLQTAWVTNVWDNGTANVVLHVRAGRGGAATIDRDYRGSLSTVNWASGVGELQGLVDHAFAKALDAIAADLRPLCAA